MDDTDDTSRNTYSIGGVEYLIYFDLATRNRHSPFLNDQYSINDLIEKSPFIINPSNAWDIISTLEWKLMSESRLHHREIRRKINRIGPTFLKKAFMLFIKDLVEKVPGIDYLLAVQLIALGKNYYDIVLDTPDYLGFIQTEIQPIELHSMLDIS